MRKVKSTNTTLFLLPALGLCEDEMSESLGFIDAFLKDEHRPTGFKYTVYVLFRPADVRKFQEFVEGEYARTSALVEDYDYADGFVVLVYHYPQAFHKDYNRFLKGKYSRFSIPFVDQFPRYEKAADGTNPNIPQISFQRMVFHKAPALVAFMEEQVGAAITDECWYIPNQERETLRIDRIRQKLKIDPWKEI